MGVRLTRHQLIPAFAICLAVTAGSLGGARGTVTGAIKMVGGLPSFRGPLAGWVTVFTPAGKVVTRQHVYRGHDFVFQLLPGRYDLKAGRELHSLRFACPAKRVTVRSDSTLHVNVGYGCDV